MGVTFHSLTMRNILLFSLVFLCFLSHLELNRIKTKVEETKPDCSSGWSAFNGNCYKHFTEKKTWEDAEDECVKEKAHLVSIHSAEEHQFVAGQGGGLLWLGGRRDSENREDWVWSDGAPWGYTNWAEGEPNNHLGRNEDCALIYPDFGKKWNDFPCSSETTFVCKKGSMEENNNHTVSWNGKCVRVTSTRLLPTNAGPGYGTNTPARCMEACDDQGFLFARVQHGHECWCGNDAPPQDRIVDMKECVHSCSGDSTLKCGGVWRMNVYKIEGETNQDCKGYERISGEGWVRVRHIPEGNTWHPVNDNLMGTAEYGDPQDDTQPWSLPWSVLEVEEFLFATGDKEKWIIVNKVQLIGADGTKEYNKGNITVRASSGNCDPYQAVMYKRSYINEDPYVNIFDHPGEVMYAENSYPHHNQLVRTHGGMDVFIKTSSNDCDLLTVVDYHYTYYNWPSTSNRLTFEARGSNDVH